MGMAQLWIAELLISDRVAEKIRSRHNQDPDAIRQALVCQWNLEYTWDNDDEWGLRAIVDTEVQERLVRCVLFPSDHPMGDMYHLGTAHPLHSTG